MFRRGGRVVIVHVHTGTDHVLVLLEDVEAPVGLNVVPKGHFPEGEAGVRHMFTAVGSFGSIRPLSDRHWPSCPCLLGMAL